MTALGVELLEGLGVTVAPAESMTYAALWLPEYRLMVLDASRDDRDLDDAIDELMPSVRERVLPDVVPSAWV